MSYGSTVGTMLLALGLSVGFVHQASALMTNMKGGTVVKSASVADRAVKAGKGN